MEWVNTLDWFKIFEKIIVPIVTSIIAFGGIAYSVRKTINGNREVQLAQSRKDLQIAGIIESNKSRFELIKALADQINEYIEQMELFQLSASFLISPTHNNYDDYYLDYEESIISLYKVDKTITEIEKLVLSLSVDLTKVKEISNDLRGLQKNLFHKIEKSNVHHRAMFKVDEGVIEYTEKAYEAVYYNEMLKKIDVNIEKLNNMLIETRISFHTEMESLHKNL